MSKNLIAAVAIIFLLLVAGGVYLKFAKSSSPSKSINATSTPQAMNQGSIKDLLTGGKNETCTISYPDNKGQGTVFISGKNIRGDFGINADGKSVQSHVISDGTYVYYWSSSQAKGFKMKYDVQQAMAASSGASQSIMQNQALDLNQKVDYKCSNWRIDLSKFTAPSDVTFTDMSALMGGSINANPSGVKIDSSACAKITDATAKAACLKAVSGY